MAPFNTHFLIAEKLWPELQNGPWKAHYGHFCFGCVAPDVDKASEQLTQKDTHFFDRSGDYEAMASRRTAAFLARQSDFLSQPFSALSRPAQAFVLGYLCHLSVDEVSKHMWRRDTWRHFHQIKATSAFAALDELAWRRAENYGGIAEAICGIQVVDVLPSIPLADLEKMHTGVCHFVQAKSAEEEYFALIDLFDMPSASQRLAYRQRFQKEIGRARAQVHLFRLEALVMAGLRHSRKRLADLIEGGQPEPMYPLLEIEHL